MNFFPFKRTYRAQKLIKPTFYICWVIVAVWSIGCNEQSNNQSVAKDAVDLELTRVDQTKFKLSEHKGKAFVLNFWASWCPPCLDELPSLIEFAKIAKKEMKLDVIAVSMDDEWSDVESLFKKLKLGSIKDSPIQIVKDDQIMSTKGYGTTKFPETFFINKEFKIQRRFIGSQNWISPSLLRWMAEHAN